jgi:putative transmembrane protein Alph_Pro_TM
VKVGFEQFVVEAARDHGLLYGFAAACMALLTGWIASVAFRRD